MKMKSKSMPKMKAPKMMKKGMMGMSSTKMGTPSQAKK